MQMDPTLPALACGAVIGGALGLSGAGGGILAVPLLVFALHLPLQQAAPVALLAVGCAAAVGAALGLREGIVRYRAAAVIGTAGMLLAPAGVALAQRVPAQPLVAAFAALLAYTAWRMAAPADAAPTRQAAPPCLLNPAEGRLRWTWPCAGALAGTGMLSGTLSGLLGVGGGFVIVPALTRCTDLDARSIAATSMAVIALVSASGTVAALAHGSLPGAVAVPFVASAVAALMAGRAAARHWPAVRVRRAFAVVAGITAVWMAVRALGGSV